MAVPTLITDLSTTPASNSPAGSENVFPNLDDYLRAQSAFLASVRDNSGNGWVSPYLPLAGGTMTGTVNGLQMASQNGGQLAGLRNKIINGSFTVNQRGITTVTPASGDYTLDRWFAIQTVAGKFSVATGAANAAAAAAGVSGALTTITSLSPYAVGAGEGYLFNQRIEGYNIADLQWGSANAKTVTLSFYVTSTLIGTFGGAIKNSANTRSYPFSYSIPVANTWTRISVTITGDTGGAFTDWLTTNGIGMVVVFSLGTGSTLSGTAGAWAATNYSSATGAVSVVGTNAATWTIANIQLEVGPVATPFEQRPYGMELALCQRYYETVYGTGAEFCGNTTNTAIYYAQYSFKNIKRAIPTIASAISVGANGFAATAGTFAATVGIVQEYRAATSTINGGTFGSQFGASAEL